MTNLTTDNTTLIDSQPLGRFQFLVIILCSLVVLFDGMDTQVVGYLGPALSSEWDIPREQLGPVFSASLVGLMVGLMIIGAISDRLGRRRSILLCVAFFSVFTLLTAFAQGVTDLMAWRFLAGIGLGGAMPNALALTGEYCPKRLKATLVIIMFCGFSLGSIIGGLVAAALLDSLGWRAVFLTGAILPLVLLPFLYKLLPESLQFLLQQNRHQQAQQILHRINPALTVSDAEEQSPVTLPKVPVSDLFSDNRLQGTLMLWGIFFMNLMVFYFLQNWSVRHR
jgi:AAHS family 4-hydroxybenzoate transporter-like MFS transporter